MSTVPLSEFFGSLERLVADLYAYRALIAIFAVGTASVTAFVAHRAGLDRATATWIRGHQRTAGAIAIVALATAIPLGNHVLAPLWTRSALEEASPFAVVVASPAEVVTPGSMLPDGPRVASAGPEVRLLREGGLAGADSFHFGRGKVLLLDVGDGSRVLRLEELSVRNGPDLFVYLSNSTSNVTGAVNLGALKATDGSFNYGVPPATDDAALDYALIWCRQFGVLFASARLASAS